LGSDGGQKICSALFKLGDQARKRGTQSKLIRLNIGQNMLSGQVTPTFCQAVLLHRNLEHVNADRV
jgi:Ran GTPase-activating protein (RanGAP) involved in mRNA processing and transport